MISGKRAFEILALTWLIVAFSASVSAKEKEITLKFATLAPEGSPWMEAFNMANRELVSRTGGTLKMRAYPGGVMGDDQTVLRKMRIGQIHIAGLTGLGVGQIDKELQVLGTPFLFQNYEEVDQVVSKISDRLEKILEKNGYVLLGWSEIGFIYMMSNKPMSSVEAVRNAKVWMPEGDPVSQAVFEKAGVSPVPLGISDVLLALQTGLVDVIYSTPFGAVALQWFTKVKYIIRVPLSFSMGAVVMTQKAFESIPEDHREGFKKVFRKNLTPINAKSRKDNEEALRLMAREGIHLVELPAGELERFQKITQEAIDDVAGKVFSKKIFRTVKNYLVEARAGKPAWVIREEKFPREP